MSYAARGNICVGRSNKEENHLDTRKDNGNKEKGKEGRGET